ncbi:MULTISPECIES: DUF2147 domain-containing protein [unclassified Bradyrhizobium]|uniref:DUF2147 domain-containing protein n=1 Tax=unclassified Bradyrhizobium TaxID=2631580 RepID=UPI000400D481|nr:MULTISPECIES: DUF2147 domain-containing protein [unclassified Bradyrhizobium]MCP3464355.1 DUF2147 domain-containing protein [Bradyrhizobium sp. CCGUVB23]
MTRLSVAATALFLASTAIAHAGNAISFEIEGQRIHIQAPRNCASLNCVTIVAPGLSKKPIRLNNINLNGFGSKDDDDTASSSTTTTAPPAPAPAAQQPAPQPQVQATVHAAPIVTAPPAPSPTVAPPATTAAVDANVTPQAAPVAPPAPVAAPVALAPTPVAAAPAPASTTPLGVWATEENKGNVRVEQCGANLCGYAEKTNEKILINMKPDGAKWSGRIHDPDSGRNYDSTIAMKGSNLLRVQGCAFGGMFCGGQTWKRVS